MKRALFLASTGVFLVIIGIGGMEYYAKGCSQTLGTCTVGAKK